jgi:NhaP-type Na+/H+ or K+/H+ antiporter
VYRAARLAESTVNSALWWSAAFAAPSTLFVETLPVPSPLGALFSIGASFAARGGAALLAPLGGGAGDALLAAGSGASRLPLLSYAPGPPPPVGLAPPPLPFSRQRGAPEAGALLRLLAAPGWRQAAILAERGEPWSAAVEALREGTTWGEGAGADGTPLTLTLVARFSPPDAHGDAEGLGEAVGALMEGSSRVVVLLASREGAAAAVAALRGAGAGERGWTLVGVDDWLGVPGAEWIGAAGVGGHVLDATALARGALTAEALAGAGAPVPGRPLPPQLAACGAPPPPPPAPGSARPAALAFSAFEAVWRSGAAAAAAPATFAARPPGWLLEALLRGDAVADFPLMPPGPGGYAMRAAWAASGGARSDGGASTWLAAREGGGVADVGEGGAIAWGAGAGLGPRETPSDRAPPAHGGGATLAVCLQLLGVAASLVVGELLHQVALTDTMPESLATIGVGLLLGLAVRSLDGRTFAAAQLSEHFFMLALLPIVIYESGYSLSQRVFFANIRPIAAFSVVGTIVSAAVTSLVIAWGVGKPEWGLPPLSAWECATLGALLSATDPVATLAVFGALRVEPRLNALVYGESVLNDAIGIVLFQAAARFITMPFTGAALVGAASAAAKILLGAIFWGSMCGVVCTMVLNFANVRGLLAKKGRMADRVATIGRVLLGGGRGGGVIVEFPGATPQKAAPASAAPATAPAPVTPPRTPPPPPQQQQQQSPAASPDHPPKARTDEFYAHVVMGSAETAMLLVFGYISFASAESVGLSGIIAALFCGVTQAVYAAPIMSWPGRKVSRAVLKLLAGLADCAIFLQIGMGLALSGDVAPGEVALAAVALVGCLAGRAANVFPIAGTLNRGGCGGREGAIPLPMQAQMWWSGLRGGIAFASALAFPSHHAGPVARAVALLCVVTVAVMGPTTVPLLRRLGIRFGVEEEDDGRGGRGSVGARAAGGWAERFERALYGESTWLRLRDAGNIDAEPLFVISPNARGGSGAAAPPAPLSPAAWGDDPAFAYSVRGRPQAGGE